MPGFQSMRDSADVVLLRPTSAMSRPLGARARSGVKWGGLGVALNLVLQLGFGDRKSVV